MLLIDEHLEQHEDDSSCVQANFKKLNGTAFQQMWYINSSQYGYGTVMNLPTIITHSGDWEVTDPLGGSYLLQKYLHKLLDSIFFVNINDVYKTWILILIIFKVPTEMCLIYFCPEASVKKYVLLSLVKADEQTLNG